MKALGPDREAFAKELLALASSDTFIGNAAEIEVILHPPPLDGLLTQLGAADGEAATKLMRTLLLVLGPRFDDATEARILQAAAGARPADGKAGLLAFFNPAQWLGEHRFDLYPLLHERGLTFSQPAAQRALATLLQDRTPLFGFKARRGIRRPPPRWSSMASSPREVLPARTRRNGRSCGRAGPPRPPSGNAPWLKRSPPASRSRLFPKPRGVTKSNPRNREVSAIRPAETRPDRGGGGDRQGTGGECRARRSRTGAYPGRTHFLLA